MAKKAATKKPEATFEVRFVAPGLVPEKIPLRAVSDALSAVQDLASGRDPFETQHVPIEKGIGLLDVRRGSAAYVCVSRAPEEALENLSRIGSMLSAPSETPSEDDRLVAALRPIQSLSEIAKSLECRLEVTLGRRHRNGPLFVVHGDDYERISSRLLLTGETTIVGRVERVGGATEMRCLMRVPNRRRLLYCDVTSKELVRRLGQHLYEEIAAWGTATWIHRTWRIYAFTISDFTQPRLGKIGDAIKELREAGLSAWDEIEDPEKYVRELR